MNFLDIKRLLELGCKEFARIVKGKSSAQLREMFNIKNDFTLEEEKMLAWVNEWARENRT